MKAAATNINELRGQVAGNKERIHELYDDIDTIMSKKIEDNLRKRGPEAPRIDPFRMLVRASRPAQACGRREPPRTPRLPRCLLDHCNRTRPRRERMTTGMHDNP